MKWLATLVLSLFGSLWCGSVADGLAEPLLVQDPANAPITLEIDLSAKSSTLLSIPLDLGSMDVGRWLERAGGLSPEGIHGWSAQAQKYVSLKTLRPGEGFLLARGPGKVSIQGQRVVANAVEFPLEKGWNLIGVPYESGIPLVDLRINLNGDIKAYDPAMKKKWVGEVKALIDGQMIPLVVEGNARLEPWRGYWLNAYQPCILVMPSKQYVEEKKGGGKAGR